MGRVKFKHDRPRELDTRRKLLSLLAPKVKVFELFPVRDGVVVRTSSDDDVDTIFQEQTQTKLREAGFTAVMPQELRSRRTLICFRIDELAYEHDAVEMKAELEKQQEWMKVDEVYKFTGSKTIKIICASCEVARKALETGILMFYISIPPSQMKTEDYTPLVVCNKCQAIECHETKMCPHPVDYKACSECAGKDHTFRECPTPMAKKCLNCNEAHSARVMRCPVRKRALKEKQEKLRKEKEDKKKNSYAQAAQPPVTPPSTPVVNSPGYMLLLEAHMADCAEPGIFQDFLSEGLALNGLPNVIMPPRPPSTAIIRAIAGEEAVARATAKRTRLSSPTPEREEVERTATSPSTINPTDDEDSSSEAEETEKEAVEEEEADKGEEAAEEEAPDVDIVILRRGSDVFPADYCPTKIRKRLAEGRYKLNHSGNTSDNKRVKKYVFNTRHSLEPLCGDVSDKVFVTLEEGPLPPHLARITRLARRNLRQPK